MAQRGVSLEAGWALFKAGAAHVVRAGHAASRLVKEGIPPLFISSSPLGCSYFLFSSGDDEMMRLV